MVEPPAIDAVRDRVPVDEIQDMIGQQEGIGRQNSPRLENLDYASTTRAHIPLPVPALLNVASDFGPSASLSRL